MCPRQTPAHSRPQFPQLCKPQAGLCCFHSPSIPETALRACLEQSPTPSILKVDTELTSPHSREATPRPVTLTVQVCGNGLSQAPLSLGAAALGSCQNYHAGVLFPRVSAQGCWGPFCHSGSGRWGRWIPIFLLQHLDLTIPESSMPWLFFFFLMLHEPMNYFGFVLNVQVEPAEKGHQYCSVSLLRSKSEIAHRYPSSTQHAQSCGPVPGPAIPTPTEGSRGGGVCAAFPVPLMPTLCPQKRS